MRRMNLRREDGVAMTEFALIVPVFLLIVAGLLAFGRVFFYWIEANHLASETARWAVVDRNPVRTRQTLQQHAAQTLDGRVRRTTSRSASTSRKARRRDLGDPRPRAGSRSRSTSCPSSGSGRSRSAAPRRCGSSASRTDGDPPAYATPTTTSGRAHEPRRLRDERGGILVMAAVMIPVFLLLTALVVDVGNWFTHKRQLQNRADAAAFAAGRRVREELEGLRPERATPPCSASTAREIADAARAVRRRPGGLRLRTRHAAGDAPQHRDREPGEPRRRHQLERPGLQRRHRLHGRRRHRRRRATRASCTRPADDISAAGHWTDVRVKERDLPSLFGSVGLPLSRNGARARDRDPPGAQRPPVPAARRAEQRDHEGAGAVLRRVPRPSHRRHDARRTLSRPLPRGPGRVRSTGGGDALGPRRRAIRRRRPEPLVHAASPELRRLRPGVPADRRRGADREPRRDQPRHQHLRAAPRDAVRRLLPRLSQIRIWNDGMGVAGAHRRRAPDRRLHVLGDAYFGTLRPSLRPTAASARTSDVNWGGRDDGNTANVSAKLHASR